MTAPPSPFRIIVAEELVRVEFDDAVVLRTGPTVVHSHLVFEVDSLDAFISALSTCLEREDSVASVALGADRLRLTNPRADRNHHLIIQNAPPEGAPHGGGSITPTPEQTQQLIEALSALRRGSPPQ